MGAHDIAAEPQASLFYQSRQPAEGVFMSCDLSLLHLSGFQGRGFIVTASPERCSRRRLSMAASRLRQNGKYRRQVRRLDAFIVRTIPANRSARCRVSASAALNRSLSRTPEASLLDCYSPLSPLPSAKLLLRCIKVDSCIDPASAKVTESRAALVVVTIPVVLLGSFYKWSWHEDFILPWVGTRPSRHDIPS